MSESDLIETEEVNSLVEESFEYAKGKYNNRGRIFRKMQ